MIYILTGKDTFSKSEFIEQLRAKKPGARFHDFQEGTQASDLVSEATSSGLFDSPKIIRGYGCLEKIDFDTTVGQLKSAADDILFIEEKLDKRKSEIKKILASKLATVREFEIPTGSAMQAWLSARIKVYALNFGTGALLAFSKKLGLAATDFGEILYDLWQVDSELKKLQQFAGAKEITVEDVSALTSENIAEDVFAIANAIADKNKQRTLQCLAQYIDRVPGADEKAKIISLSAIVAEQFRGMLLVQGLLARQAADTELVRQTGFSPGKIFVYKKIAKGFSAKKLTEALSKLALLDAEIKTSSGPAALPFYMIINSALS